MNLVDLQTAVSELSSQDLEEFTAWFSRFHPGGTPPARDDASGVLDHEKLKDMTQKAIEEFRQDQT